MCLQEDAVHVGYMAVGTALAGGCRDSLTRDIIAAYRALPETARCCNAAPGQSQGRKGVSKSTRACSTVRFG